MALILSPPFSLPICNFCISYFLRSVERVYQSCSKVLPRLLLNLFHFKHCEIFLLGKMFDLFVFHNQSMIDLSIS